MEDDEQLCTAYNSSYYQDNIEVLRKKARDRYRKRKYPPSVICVCAAGLSTAEAAPALIYATDTRERSGERRRRLGDKVSTR